MANNKYQITYRVTESKYFKNDPSRPVIKKTNIEQYELEEYLVIEAIEDILNVPHKRYESTSDVDSFTRNYLSSNEKDIEKFIENNNKVYDFWKLVSQRINDWMVLFANRKYSNFKHFTINLDEISWIEHDLDYADCEDSAYIDIKKL